ncbi:Folate transporter [Vigna angularis]|uniref:Folate transporter n=1 Tax=Phaseolus angularis TaxID=3914 RepID=A0A8T0L9J8_PHAAN|nr:Folate transporter [Vigna angularis]
MSAEASKRHQWQWENATAGAAAGFATVAVMHPLDVVRTRFQVNDGRVSHLPSYKNTAHAVFTIARSEEIALSHLFELMAFASISWFVKYATCYDFRMSLFLKKEKYPDRMIAEPSSATEAVRGKVVCCPLLAQQARWLWGWGNHESMFLVNGWLLLSLDVIFHLVHGLTFTNMITVALAVKTNSKAQCSSIHILFIGLGLRGLYAGFLPGVLGSTISWGLYFFFYDKAKQRYARNREGKLSPGLHLASAAEAGGFLVHKSCLASKNEIAASNSTSSDTTILWDLCALYRGIVPGLFLVSHGAIQFTAYEELRKVIVDFKSKRSTVHNQNPDKLLNSVDYAVLGATSKLAAILLTYPFQVMRARLQQRPSGDGVPRYMDTWHVVKETARFEGIRGYYRGITANLLKNAPASSITFIVYENVLKLLKPTTRND